MWRTSGRPARTRLRALVVGALLVALTTTASDASAAGGGKGRAFSDAQIVVTEQASDQILVLESDAASWAAAEVVWRWKPTAADGLGDLVDNWGLPDEA
ncbi:MAG TPA: hypothetical protein VI076_12645, partial [Actinopolymorphaceae bacterium]